MIVFLAIVGAVIAIAIIVAFMNRFYRKSTRDVALVRAQRAGVPWVTLSYSDAITDFPFDYLVPQPFDSPHNLVAQHDWQLWRRRPQRRWLGTWREKLRARANSRRGD